MVNISESSIYYLDPLGEKENNKNKLLVNWTAFCHSISVFRNKKWKVEMISHSKQIDSNNCGVYVCQFLNFLIKGKDLRFDDSPDDLLKLREEINGTFKNNSLRNYCSFCGNALEIGEETLLTNCIHRYHANCSSIVLKSKSNFFCPLCY